MSERLTEALPVLEQAVEQASSLGIMGYQALRVTWLGEAYLLASRLHEAATQAQHALELSHAYHERGHEAHALRLLGEIAARREPPESSQAESHYLQALALANELGMRPSRLTVTSASARYTSRQASGNKPALH
jgi:hypothetical protein